MENIKLCSFVYDKRKFVINGSYEVLDDSDSNWEYFEYPDFTEASAKEILDENKTVDYEPEGYSWLGHKYNAYDMICTVVSNQICGTSVFQIEYMEEGLQKLIEEYRKELVYFEDNKGFPRRILSVGMTLYELALVTDQYMYYFHYDEVLMLSTESMEVISDNYFASVGFEDSKEAIQEGKETILWVDQEFWSHEE